MAMKFMWLQRIHLKMLHSTLYSHATSITIEVSPAVCIDRTLVTTTLLRVDMYFEWIDSTSITENKVAIIQRCDARR